MHANLLNKTSPRVFFDELSKNFQNVSSMRCKNFQKVHKNTVEKMFGKYLSADGCFVETILLTVMRTMMLSVS